MGWIVGRKVWQHKKVMQPGSQHTWVQAVEMGLTEGYFVSSCWKGWEFCLLYWEREREQKK